MPTVRKTPTGETTVYGMNELPNNVKKFVKELSSIGINDIDDITYKEFVPYPEFTDEDDMPVNDVSIFINIDAEDAVKNKPNRFEGILQDKAENIGKYFSIEDVYVFVKYINKEEFAKKFLKKLKEYLKTTQVSHAIHSIGYNVKERGYPEIKVTKKRYFSPHVYESDIKEVIEGCLKTLGYSNIKIYFP